MKKLYLLLLIAFISISTVSAQVSYGGLNYTTNTSNNTATVASNQSTALLGAITIPATITDGTTTYQVTALDNYCFQGCTGITAVTLPNSITTVGYYCFQNCTSLTSAEINGTPTTLSNMFNGCTKLTSVTLPSSVIELFGTFQGCTSLTSVVIPSSVTRLQQTFSGCTSLTSLNIPSSVTDLPAAFNGCTNLTTVDIPSSVTYFGSTFYGCTNLKNLICHWNLPSSVNANASAFQNVPKSSVTLTVPNGTATLYRTTPLWSSFGRFVEQGGVTQVVSGGLAYILNMDGTAKVLGHQVGDLSGTITIPASIADGSTTYSVTALADSCFMDCSSITSVSLPSGITTLGTSCFEGCSSLTSCNIPETITSIGDYCFKICTALTTMDVHGTPTSLSNMFYGCTNLTSVTLPSSVTNLQQAFQGCTSLTTVVLPSSVTNLTAAFKGCTNLTSMIIPSSVTNIDGTFSGCSQLSTIDIPSSVTSLLSTFNGCTSLTNITCHWTSLNGVLVQSSTFTNVPTSSATLVVPNGKATPYRTTPLWSSFGRFVEQDGVTQVVSGGLAYTLNTDGTAKVSDHQVTTLTGTITIPASITDGSTTYQVTALDDYCFKNCANITSVILPNGITTLGKNCFDGCSSLTSCNIPETITSIGDWCFKGCTALTSMDIHGTPPTLCGTFYGCSQLASVTLPSSVTSLQEAFHGCTSLTTVDIPSSVTNLQTTFSGCTNLTSVVIPSSVTNMSGTFYECSKLTTADIPSSVTNLLSTFSGCTNLTSLTCHWNSLSTLNSVQTNDYTFQFVPVSSVPLIVPKGMVDLYRANAPWSSFTNIVEASGIKQVTIGELKYTLNMNDGTAKVASRQAATLSGVITIPATVTDGGTNYQVTTLADSCFYRCNNITSVSLPSSITTFENCCFEQCSKLTSCNIPDAVDSMGYYAFKDCIALTSMDVHGTMKKLDTPFEGCTNLTSVTLPSSVTEMFATFQDCTSLTTVVIPSSVTSLQQAFNGCTSITTMDIPSSVTNLQATFGRCTNLTSMIIPPSVTNLGGTFYGCTKLTTLDIPASVDTLTATFNGCTNLTNLTCHWTSLSKLDTNEYTFQDVPVSSVSLSVPKGSSDIYRTTFPWSAFKLFVEQDGVNSASPCEVPTITYADKKLNFVTTTDGAQIYYDVTSVDVKNGDIASATDLSLDQAYKIVAYAWKDGYTRSDSTTAVLYFVAPAEIPSGVQALQTDNRGILVKSAGGIITVSGLTDGETVTVYTIGGTSLGSAKASAGQASITVSTSDHIVIITVGSKSIKYAL